MDNPKISVLVPVYKVERYVERCLRSLFANTIIAGCEVIIVDDCSPDGSMGVVRRVLDEYPHLRENVVLRSHDCNRGSAAARNTALLQAHGAYIICVDSDDWVEPTYLEELYDEAERSGADITGCNVIREYGDRSEPIAQEFPRAEDGLRWLLSNRINGWLFQKLFRKSFIDAHGLHWIEGLDLWEDVLFSAKAFRFARILASTSGYLYHYDYTNQSSLCHNVDRRALGQIFGVMRELEDFLAKSGCLDTCRAEFLARKVSAKLVALCGSADGEQYLALWEDDRLHTVRTAEPLPLRRRFLLYLCDTRRYRLARLWLRAMNAWRALRYGRTGQ